MPASKSPTHLVSQRPPVSMGAFREQTFFREEFTLDAASCDGFRWRLAEEPNDTGKMGPATIGIMFRVLASEEVAAFEHIPDLKWRESARFSERVGRGVQTMQPTFQISIW